MELVVKIFSDFKLLIIFAKKSILDVSQVPSSPEATINQTFLTHNKRAISRLFGTMAFSTQPGFYLNKVNNRSTKNTRARRKIC